MFVRLRAALALPMVLAMGTVSQVARAADESGITTTDALAVISDGKAKGVTIALAVFGLILAFKIIKKVTSAV